MNQLQNRPDSDKTKAELLAELEAVRAEAAQWQHAFRCVLVRGMTQRQQLQERLQDQLQDQLQVTQARLEHLLSASLAVIYSCQAFDDYAATFISDNVAQMLGYNSKEFLQTPNFWANGIHPDDAERVFTQLAHLFETGSHAHEYRFRHQDGTYRWVKDECKLVRDAAGQPLEIVGYWVDISDRVFAETELNLLNVQLEQRILERTAELQTANQALQQEIAQRQQAEAALRQAHDELEMRVQERTMELAAANTVLQAEIDQRQQQQALLTAQNQVLEAIATGKALPAVLAILARAMEQQSPNAMCSILLASPDGTKLGNGVAPSLPVSYNAAINNGVAIAPISGSCGTAAYRRETVVVTDIETDPLWTVFRDVALAHGLRACWSHPILSSTGRVLGTFAMYYPTAYHPSDRERVLVEKATYLARIAIERDFAEQALRQSERRYANLAQAAPVGIFRTNCQGSCVYVNDRWCEIAGLTHNAALGTGWISNIHPQDRERLFSEWYRAAQQQTMFCSEYRFQRPDGTITWVFGQAVAEKDSYGEILGYIGTITDISDRKQAEIALYQSNSILQSVIESTPDIIFVKDLQGRYVVANSVAADWLGTTVENMLGKDDAQLFPPEYAQELVQLDRELMLAARSAVSEETIPKQGEMRTLLTTKCPWQDSQGNIIGLIGISHDISDRKQIEAELRAAKANLELRVAERTAELTQANECLQHELIERQRTQNILQEQAQLLDLAHDTIVTSNLDRTIAFWNRGAERMYGWTKAEAIGQSIHSLLQTQFPQPLEEIQTKLFRDGYWEGELIHNRRDGTPLVVASRLVLQQDKEGQPTKILEINNDITARKQAELALKESEVKFRQLAETIEEVFWISDPRIPQLIYVSPAYEAIWGRSCATLYANFSEWIAAIHPDDRQRVQTSFFERVAQGLYDEEYRITRPDGTIRWIRDRGFPIHDESGKLQRVAGIAEDITNRKLAEAALRESEARIKALLDNAQSVIYMKDREGRYLSINRRYEELFHIKSETHIGKTDYDIFPPAIAESFQINDRAVLASNAPVDVEEVAWQDGEPHTYISTKFPVYDDSGVAFAVCGISTDITGRKQAEEALRESEVKFRQIAENLDDVVWIADANHQVIYVSPVYAKIWGQSCEELYRDSSKWLQAVHPEDRPQVEQALQATSFHGGYDAEYRIIRPDGGMHWIRDRGFLIKNEAGEVYRIAGIAEDISDRKLAEAILYQRQQEFIALVENSPDVVARFDRQLRHVYINSAIEKELGIPPQAFIGKTIREMGFPAELVNTFEPALQKVLATGQEQIIELSAQTANRRTFSQTRLIPETAPDGTVNSILALGRDITAIRAAEIAQRQQMEREQLINAIVQQMRESLNLEEILNKTVTQLQAFFQADRVVVYQLESNGSGKVVAQAVAPGWKSLLDLVLSIEAFPLHTQQQYLRGKIGTICDRDSGNIPPCLVNFMHQTQARAKLTIPIIQQHKLWGLLIVHQCSQPREWQAWESQLLQQLANKMAIAIQQSQLHQQLQIELQERRQIEQALRQSETEFRLLSENSPLGIFRTNDRGEYTYINPRYQLICDCTFEEAMGKGWLQLIHPENRDFVISQNSKAVCEMKPCLSEFHFIRKDGSSRYCRVQATPLFNEHGTYMGHVGTLEDITESRAIAQMKNDFIGIVSHELRTPLTSLRGSLGLLATGVYDKKPEKGKRMLQVAADSAARLVRLVSDILDLERLESGKITLEQQNCNAADLMLQSVEAMRASAEQNQVTLSVTPLQMQIWAAPDAIIQTLTNLLSNAVKFSAPGSTVWLSAELGSREQGAGSREEGQEGQGDKGTREQGEPTTNYQIPNTSITFQVKDQGRGIPADKLETIFGQFQQVDVSDSRQKGGTGLGLAICRSIIRQHGGQIWAESTFGEGSSFYFTLPLNTVTSDQ